MGEMLSPSYGRMHRQHVCLGKGRGPAYDITPQTPLPLTLLMLSAPCLDVSLAQTFKTGPFSCQL